MTQENEKLLKVITNILELDIKLGQLIYSSTADNADLYFCTNGELADKLLINSKETEKETEVVNNEPTPETIIPAPEKEAEVPCKPAE